MAKLYSKKKLVTQKMKPKKETISFLLNYSKALSIHKVGNSSFEIIAIKGNASKRFEAFFFCFYY